MEPDEDASSTPRTQAPRSLASKGIVNIIISHQCLAIFSIAVRRWQHHISLRAYFFCQGSSAAIMAVDQQCGCRDLKFYSEQLSRDLLVLFSLSLGPFSGLMMFLVHTIAHSGDIKMEPRLPPQVDCFDAHFDGYIISCFQNRFPF